LSEKQSRSTVITSEQKCRCGQHSPKNGYQDVTENYLVRQPICGTDDLLVVVVARGHELDAVVKDSVDKPVPLIDSP
jgi:hypothetical protein